MALEHDPGSTANTAYDIDNLSDSQNITEFIGSTDSTDIYKFSLTETSDFSLLVSNYHAGWGGSSDLGAYLYIDLNQNGQIEVDDELLYKDESYNFNEDGLNINSTLGAADYFLSINRRQDDFNGNYTLNLSAPANPPSIDTDPGSTADEAYEIQYINLDTSEDNRTIKEFIGITDTVDLYKFSLEQTTDVNLKLTGFPRFMAMNLFVDSNQNGQIDDDERLYYESNNSILDKEVLINSTLGAADYFISVVREENSTNTNYNLDFKFVADPLSTISVIAQDAEAKEEGTNAGKFRITRDGDTSEPYTVNYEIATGGGQATNGTDYEELSGSVTIPAEAYYVDLFVNPIDDDVVEQNEAVSITLREVDGDLGTGTTQTATVTIEDNDVIPTFTIEAADGEAKEEGEATGKFRIRHDVNTNKPQTVNYRIATGSGQAVNGEDYEELSGSVTIPEGQDYAELTVKPKEDFLVEGTEKVTITVEDVDGNPGTQDNQTASINLVDNDRHPNFTIEATDGEAKEEGAETANFRISHDGNTAISHTVNYRVATGDGQAVNGEDYEELSGSVMIPEGQDYIDLTVKPQEDLLVEGTETVAITVEDVDGNPGTQDNQTATVNILDNDRNPEPNLLLTEVYRFYQYENGYHLYTADENEISYVKQQSDAGDLAYSYEGEKYQVLADNIDMLTGEEIAGVEPIYRFFNTGTGAHLYTMNEDEKDYVVSNLSNYNFEGIKYYAFEIEPENVETVPVYRMLNTQSGAHLFSSDLNEIGYIEENLPHFAMENNGDAVFHVLEL